MEENGRGIDWIEGWKRSLYIYVKRRVSKRLDCMGIVHGKVYSYNTYINKACLPDHKTTVIADICPT
jgi:hypothetical protein